MTKGRGIGSGKARKPDLMHALDGTTPREKRGPHLRTRGVPKLDPSLSPEERLLAQAVCRALPAGLLTLADSSVLERMAIAWARYRECQRQLKADGLLTKQGNGAMGRSPWLLVQRQAADEMHTCATALGLSPLARTRLTVRETAEKDPLELLLDGRGSEAWTN